MDELLSIIKSEIIKEKKKQYMKEYCSRPDIKEKRKQYKKEYNSRPYIKKRQKEYYLKIKKKSSKLTNKMDIKLILN